MGAFGYYNFCVKLIALYSIFDGEELLEGSVRQIRPFVDFVLCSVQTVSYTGEIYEGGAEKCHQLKRIGLVDQVATFTPSACERGQINELRKRFGAMMLGFKAGFTHFFHIDCDEYFIPEQFKAAKDHLEATEAEGSIVYSQAYFKRPDWELDDIDKTFFPFIHKYSPGLTCCGSNFPYLCDPTRTVGVKNVVVLPREMILQHHYSWVREDVGRKVRNSSTSGVLHPSGVLEDYEKAAPGSYVRLLDRRIRQGKNLFNIAVGTETAVA
jgi:hypothetical protein